ncbi:NAD(P)/FAD-dependent oxidoreductase [Roseovarius pacificus]|uniref:NAD(P)/FAD-dependent oxidoreductase n=1 Tax=Roseovarius pacificus TaxID=337701 RepID=UPI002A189853|nr:NAD(P)/FAD-dependent oxidoreductase [Roseovarius pacificus]
MATQAQVQHHKHRVVIIGSGFGGLHAAQKLAKVPVEVTLIDRRNHHLFQPLLYQVATGGLSPANIAAPLRRVFRKQSNCVPLLGEVTGIDPEARVVRMDGQEVPYDSLVIAAGAQYQFFGHPEWGEHAIGLKSVEDATAIRRRFLLALETASRCVSSEERRALLTFTIVGAGPTGVEMAGALREISGYMTREEYRGLNPSEVRVLLIEIEGSVLPSYPEKLRYYALRTLQKKGVDVRLDAQVTDIQAGHVKVCGARDEDASEEQILTRTVIWAAGVRANPLGETLAKATGAETGKGGRIRVNKDLSVPGYPDIFVLGDMALFDHDSRGPLPGLAAVAKQQGKFVAKHIARRIEGRPSERFYYRDLGQMATIGRSSAVARIGPFKLTGLTAWLLWLHVHLLELVSFEERILVLIQWTWNYLTWNRSARLITGPSPLPLPPKELHGDK